MLQYIMRIKQIPLRVKMLILLITIGIGSMVSVSVYYFKMNERAIVERTFEQLTSIRVVKKRQIEAFFKDRVRESQLVATSTDVKEMIRVLNQQSMHGAYDTAMVLDYSDYVNKYLVSSGYFKKLIIVDAYGNVFLDSFENQTANISFEEIKNLKQAPVLSDLFSKAASDSLPSIIDFNFDFDAQTPSMYIVCRAEYEGLPGPNLLVLQLSLDAINDIMLENSVDEGLGHSGESYLVGNDFYMRSTSRFSPNSVMQLNASTQATKNALQGISGTGSVYDYRDVKVFSSYSKLNINELDWAILAEIDYNEAMLPLYTTRNDIVYIGILLGMIIIGLSVFFSSHIIAPIRKLKEAVLSIEQGNYDVQIELNNTDEVGRLVTAFNRMAKQISMQTQELKNREERLSHFYSATTDGIFVHRQGEPLLVNKAMELLTELTEQQLMATSLPEIIQCKTTKDGASYETFAKKADGALFPVEIQEGEIEYKGQKVKACIIRDISRRKSVEEALEYERKQRLSALFDGQEQERQRLSRELHDGIGQRLIALKLFLESTNLQSADHLLETTNLAKNALDEIIAEIRQISGDIMPIVLNNFGLEKAIKQLCENYRSRTGRNIKFDAACTNQTKNPKILIHLYRIAQEAITNAVKHAAATEINVQLIETAQHISLIIEDNGCGFDDNNRQLIKGNGIYNMRERARLLNGRIDIRSQNNQGTLINVRVQKN